MKEHCWHKTGNTHHHVTAGKDEVECCHCGHKSQEYWKLERQQVDGHGPYAVRQVKVSVGVEDKSECKGLVL